MAHLSPNTSVINYLKTGSNYTDQKTKVVRVDLKKTPQLYTVY